MNLSRRKKPEENQGRGTALLFSPLLALIAEKMFQAVISIEFVGNAAAQGKMGRSIFWLFYAFTVADLKYGRAILTMFVVHWLFLRGTHGWRKYFFAYVGINIACDVGLLLLNPSFVIMIRGATPWQMPITYQGIACLLFGFIWAKMYSCNASPLLGDEVEVAPRE